MFITNNINLTGAYRATPIRELEKEVLVPLINIYCSEL
jgi:hypothetical protein